MCDGRSGMIGGRVLFPREEDMSQPYRAEGELDVRLKQASPHRLDMSDSNRQERKSRLHSMLLPKGTRPTEKPR